MTEPSTDFPEPSEYDAFYAGYISCVTDPDVLSVLSRQQSVVLDLLGKVSEERSSVRYAPGKWSLKEVVGHLIDTERLFSYRGLCIARGENQGLPGFDQDDYVATGLFGTRSMPNLLGEYDAVRTSSIQLFRNFDPSVWSNHGVANEVIFSVRAIAFIIAGHEAHHLKVIRSKYLGA
jgi:hypothetical protein